MLCEARFSTDGPMSDASAHLTSSCIPPIVVTTSFLLSLSLDFGPRTDGRKDPLPESWLTTKKAQKKERRKMDRDGEMVQGKDRFSMLKSESERRC